MRPRLRVGVVILVVVGCAASATAWAFGRTDAARYGIEVFSPPSAFCEGIAPDDSLLDQVDGVAATEGPEVRASAGSVRAGLMRRLALVDDAPERLRPHLQKLANDVEEAGRTGDFRAARRRAAELDPLVADRCR